MTIKAALRRSKIPVRPLALDRSAHVAKIVVPVKQNRVQIDPLGDIVRRLPHIPVATPVPDMVYVFWFMRI